MKRLVKAYLHLYKDKKLSFEMDGKIIDIELDNLLSDKENFKNELSKEIFAKLVNKTKSSNLSVDLIVIGEQYSFSCSLPRMNKVKRTAILKEEINDVYYDFENKTYKCVEEVTSIKGISYHVTLIKKDIIEEVVEVLTKMKIKLNNLYSSSSYLASSLVERKEKTPFLYVEQKGAVIDVVAIKNHSVIYMNSIYTETREDISLFLESIQSKYFCYEKVTLIFNNVKNYCSLNYQIDNKKEENKFRAISFLPKKNVLKGFTLVEVIVSLSIFSLTITSVLIGFQITAKLNQKNRETNFAYLTINNMKEVFFSFPASFPDTFIEINGGDYLSSSSYFNFDKNGRINEGSSYFLVDFIYDIKEKTTYYFYSLKIKSFNSTSFKLVSDVNIGEICLLK